MLFSFKSIFNISFFLALSSTIFAQKSTDFVWPNGAIAAICLTYDDGLPSHINTVAPILDQYGFKGTFYITLNSGSVYKEMDKWKLLVQNNHELGNHSVYHPCQKSLPNMEWVKSYYDLDHYTVEEMYAEIQVANSFLKSLDGTGSHTYAYPCNHFIAGGESYKNMIDKYVISARGSMEHFGDIVAPYDIDLYNVPSWAPSNLSGDDLIEYVQQIINKKTLGVFTFHGVGDEYLVISSEAHEKLLKFLDKNRSKIWVTTFKEATDYIKSHR